VILQFSVSSPPHDVTKTILKNYQDGSVKELFKVWHFIFQKEYSIDTQEALKRYKIFKETLQTIKAHNALNLPYTMGLNQFSDMTNQEFREKMCTKKDLKGAEFDALMKNLKNKPFKFLSDDDIDDLTKRRNLQPSAGVNWSSAFNAPRDQGQCGCCWAFSTTGAVEGNLAIKNGGTPVAYLSPQQLLDCDTTNNGCNGGDLGLAMTYVQQTGVMADSVYPYQTAQGTCQFNQSQVAGSITSFNFCSNYSNDPSTQCTDQAVQNLLATGPVSVGIDGGTDDFQNYNGGVFTAACSQDNHAVIAVGYGTDSQGGDYWLVRNSWGATWGESGYIRVSVNDKNNNSCFVSNAAYLPVV